MSYSIFLCSKWSLSKSRHKVKYLAKNAEKTKKTKGTKSQIERFQSFKAAELEKIINFWKNKVVILKSQNKTINNF